MVLPTESPLRVLHLFSGYGGFELALRLAGIPARTVAHVEREAHAAATLVARMEDQALDQAPVWSDIESFDGSPWSGRVDLVTAGFPCQPFSSAGQRRGVDDDRWLWPQIARVLGEVGPDFVFLENVPQLVKRGLPHVLADLAELGFDAEWGLLSAAAVGAPHRRQRFWLLAYSDLDGLEGLRGQAGNRERHPDGQGGSSLADASCIHEREPHDPECTESRQRTRQDAGWRGCFPPLPDDHEGWERWIAQGGPEPQVRRMSDGRPPGLADALHLGGNGLVPLVAAAALRQLVERAMKQRAA